MFKGKVHIGYYPITKLSNIIWFKFEWFLFKWLITFVRPGRSTRDRFSTFGEKILRLMASDEIPCDKINGYSCQIQHI